MEEAHRQEKLKELQAVADDLENNGLDRNIIIKIAGWGNAGRIEKGKGFYLSILREGKEFTHVKYYYDGHLVLVRRDPEGKITGNYEMFGLKRLYFAEHTTPVWENALCFQDVNIEQIVGVNKKGEIRITNGETPLKERVKQ